MSRKSKTVLGATLAVVLSAVSAWSQPTPAPTAGDLPCKEENQISPTDTVNSGGGVDADGYFPLFDGTFKGWFQSCKTFHSGGSNQGAIFRIGQSEGKPAIYTTQRGSGTGGIMMTNRKFTNYEIVFQTWPDFNNDAGLFNRVPITGACFQTVLDWIGGGAIGGTWGEAGFTSRDLRPFGFGGSMKDISIPGNGNGANWTTITSKLNPTSYGCPASGCTQDNWRTLFDFAGWNDFKVQFYGGSANGTGNIHMKAWFKQPNSTVWVPLSQDTTLNQVVPANFIGFQVHGQGRFSGTGSVGGNPKGTWYRDIRWKPLDDKGIPIPQQAKTGSAVRSSLALVESRLSANATALTGMINMDYTISIQDLRGRTLESFSGRAGSVNHAFQTGIYGPLMLRIKTVEGIKSLRVTRIPR